MERKTYRVKRVVNVLLGLIVVCLVCTGAVYDATGIDVIITEINEFENVENSFNVRTREAIVDKIMADNEIEIDVHDKINVDVDSTVENGDEIIIRRGVQVTINDGEEYVICSSTGKVVEEALRENGFFLGESDYTIPEISGNVEENMEIKIVRVKNEVAVREEKIPFETKYVDDNTIYVGETKVKTEGVTGVVKITENVVYENGEEISRTEAARETVTEKVDKVIAKGTKKKPVVQKPIKKNTSVNSKKTVQKRETKTETVPDSGKAKSSDKGFSYKKVMNMTATAYSAFKKSGGYGKTASGMTARFGVVAVDPKVIPLGTKLYVEGYGYAVAADTGGAIKGNKIDLCFEKPNKELMAFGRKTVTVYILE